MGKLSLSHHRSGIRALGQLQKTEKGLIPVSVLQAGLEGVLPYLELFFSARIIDLLMAGNVGKTVEMIVLFALLVAGAGLGLDGLSGVHTYLADRAHRKMLRRINQKAMELEYAQMEDTGLLHKIADAFYTMEHIGGYNAFIGFYQQLLKNLVQVAIAFVAVVRFSLLPPSGAAEGWIAWLSAPPVSFCLLMLVTVGNLLLSQVIAARFKRYRSYGHQQKIKVERTLDYFADKVFMNWEMGKEIRLFSMLDLIVQKHSKALKESIQFYNRYYSDTAKNQESLYLIIQSLCTLAAYFVVICKVLSGGASIGQLSQYIGTIVLFNQAVRMCLAVNQKIALQAECITTFQDFLALETNPSTGNRKIPQPPEEGYCIEFHHVSFRYPGAQANALTDVCCKITSRTKAAVVGRNGAGKTTFVKLLCRLYTPTEGKITLNGVDIREYCDEDYFSLFSVVFQDFSLFPFPVGENIAAGENLTAEKVWDCLNKAGLQERVRQMPRQLGTNLHKYDEDGSNMSGGESQKLAIARALYKDAPLVILDEPTAALDPESEYAIFSTLNRLVENKGSVFISHRMGSCRYCQEIFVFDGGRIVEHGTHPALMEAGGLFQAMYTAQAEQYEKAAP